MLLHLDAHDKRGGVVSIPPQTLVQVPGHGLKQIDSALGYGGASLLVKTVEQLTHVKIDHYARIDFTGVSNLLNAIGGVNVTLPKETVAKANITLTKKTVTKEYTFHAGVNHLNGITAVYYVRNPSLSPDSRVLLQQNLLRAILDKITNEHLLTNPLTAIRVVHATGRHADRGQQLHQLRGGEFCQPGSTAWAAAAGTFVTAPTHTVSGAVYLNSSLSNKLWAAIRHDSIAAFAAEYPATITTAAPG